MKHLSGVILAAVLAGGCAYNIGEQFFFVPKPAEQLVTDPALMRIVGEELITSPAAEGDKNFTPITQPRLPATLVKELHPFGKEGRQVAVIHASPANAKAGEPLIVYCGGNASDMINRGVYYVNKLLPWGELLLWDYPGFGHSNGAPWASSFDDVFAEMVPWIDEQAKDRPLVLWGHSIGGLICSRIARTSREVDAIILETTALSPQRLAKDRTWALPIVDVQVQGDWRSFDIPEMLSAFAGPVMVIGAEEDKTLVVNLAREVDAALKAKGLDVTYVEYAGKGHMDAALHSGFADDASVFFRKVSDSRN
jgi:pimeloyl-ACP methyl ester carboxylesterase